jgi:hypothetical protein
MATSRHPHPRARRRTLRGHAQHGVVLLYGLIVLAIMLIGAAAMVRSMNTSLVNAGNIGFKRDLTNQAERAAATALTLLQTGALATVAARQGGLPNGAGTVEVASGVATITVTWRPPHEPSTAASSVYRTQVQMP